MSATGPVILGHIYCPSCGNGPYAVMPGWRLCPHGPRSGCRGPDSDIVLWTAMGLPIRYGRPWSEPPWWADRESAR